MGLILTQEQLQEVFEELDADESGVLNLEEFQEACHRFKFAQNEDVAAYFKSVDTNNSGFIDFDEFMQAILGRKPSTFMIEMAVDYTQSKISKIETKIRRSTQRKRQSKPQGSILTF